MPATSLPSIRVLIQSSWNRFWRFAGCLILVYALAEIITLGVYYLTGGWTSVRLSLGLPVELTGPLSDLSFTRAEIGRLSLEWLGLGLVNTIVFGLAAIIINDRLAPGATLRRFAPRLPALIMVSLLTGLAVLAGTVLLIIPGIIASVWFLFAGFIVVLENRSPWLALKLSRRLTRAVFWPVLFRWLAIMLLIGALGLLVNSLPVAGALANALLLGPFSTVFIYELYLACRTIEPAGHDQ